MSLSQPGVRVNGVDLLRRLGVEPYPYERAVCFTFLNNNMEFAIGLFSHDPASGHNQWRIIHLDIGCSRLIEPPVVMEWDTNDLTAIHNINFGSPRDLLTTLENERNPTNGYFNWFLETRQAQ